MGGKVVTVTSGKGGVGKTTATANLGISLATLGKSVVVIDADIGLRNLDVIMGLENRIVYDLVDIVEGRAKLRQAMRVQIKHIQRSLRITTVYVTHDQIEAMTLADRIAIMQSGSIQQIGTPDDIYNDPANTFVAGFIGSPPMNLVGGDLKGGVFNADGIRVEGLPKCHDGKVTLGIRPEDCSVGGESAQLTGTVYGVEPTGDTTYLTIRSGGKLFEVKADRSYRAAFDCRETVSFDPARIHLFESAGGQRLQLD